MAAKDQTPAERGNGKVSQLSPFQKLVRRMADMATMDESSGRVTGEDINPILTAETEEEMWDADELAQYNAQKLSGCDLELLWFEVKYGTGNEDIKTPFTTPEGRQMYLLVHAFRITEERGEDRTINLPPVGEEFVWNTSARNIVGKLFWMLEHGWFDPKAEKPVRVHIQGTKLQGGRSVEKLKEFKGTPLVSAVVSEPPF
jgi:hypothetical protein